ncbi:HD domain-containing phosphohydrolase [Bacteriovorax sp. DB6_IX]|uniref:HD domain-containing phosphohydrolase n=2 Tax=Bacteriovorax sp. DB6_IX TaxID=1353530 RepID=UPI00038A2A5B|nr:HD domain-containing phosphohydrolase [Bacteriovorax sp. DB6_IX]EQC52614.1 HD domain protein [Bacteriovorax sp. DB6_IX]
MKALYICDDKEEWNHIRNLFASHFPKVELICVLDGNDAIEYLSYEGPFALILIEASIKTDSPTELTKRILEVSGERPVIFLGAKAYIQDRVAEELYLKSEINDIVIRPIEIPKFKEAIKKAIDWASHEEFEQSIEEIDREELLPMKLRNFYLFDSLPYDVYLELTQTKFIKIISANKRYSHSDINAYAKKNVKFLYLQKNEYLKFLEDGIEKLLIIFDSPKLSAKKIIANQIRSVLIIHQYVQTVGVSENLIKLCDKVISITRDVTLEYKKFRNILPLFPKAHSDLAEQAVMTMYLSETILTALGWASETSRKKLGLASLLYDSMLTNDDLSKIRSLEDPQLQMFTVSEQEEFKDHPLKAASMAQYFQGYPDTDFIIAQHHERPKGDGFPHKLTNNKLTAHSCAFILSNNFVTRLVSDGKDPGVLLNIFREMKSIYNQGNFKEPLSALQRSIV